ncbi:MAG: HlyD family efflux transporter periplasmic adaptor subunit [Rhodocyclaceae bacterium]|nr:HlyD family efflux transporter periplasmic adaptor subunit [Rhodocyclaceae bacterium]
MTVDQLSPNARDATAAPRPATDDWQRISAARDAAEFCRAWLALQCGRLAGARAALLLLESEARTFVPAAVWPAEQVDVHYLGPVAERCLREQSGQIVRGDAAGAHTSIGYPIEVAGAVQGAVVVDLERRSEAELQAALRELYWGVGRLETLLFQRRLDNASASLARARLALDICAAVGEQNRLDAAALLLVNELSHRLGAERVALGLEKNGLVRLVAVSGAAHFERKSDFAVALENAMEEALDQGRSIAWPQRPGHEGDIAVAQRDLAGSGAAVSVVLSLRGRAFGAITCQTSGACDENLLRALEAVAALVSPLIDARRELAHWFAGRARDAARDCGRALRDPRRPGFRAAALVAVLIVAFLSFADGTYRVAARSVVEGEVQRSIVAPFDAFVASAEARAGQSVKAGALLATLDDRDLNLERQKWLSEAEQAERKYREALARHERADARILSAQLAAAQVQLDLTDNKIARARLTAPFDGVVVSGDLSQNLGSPVEKGKLLFEVAPLDAYRVILKVSEDDIRHVKVGQQGQIVLAGMSDRSLPFTVKNIGVAAPEEGQNLFRVEAQLADPVRDLRPGMEGVGKIVVGERRYVWIWTHGFLDWLRLKLWHWIP